MKKKAISMLLILAMLITLAVPAFAEAPEVYGDREYTAIPGVFDTVEEEEKMLFDLYVIFDGNEFLITEAGWENLSRGDIARLLEILDASNSLITETVSYVEVSDDSFYYVSDESIVFAEMYSDDERGVGVNRVEVHWWGLRIFLSAGTVRTIGVGVTIAGIWIPAPVVRGVVATLGVLLTQVTRGVRFDIRSVGIIVPWAAVGNVRFQ